MIRFATENGEVMVDAETMGYGIYLDNDSLIDLAKGAVTRRKRFVAALRTKGTLLFSGANAIEVAGPTGYSADAVRDFLDSIGPHWVPLKLDPWEVAKREAAGLRHRAVVSPSFMQWYSDRRIADLSPDNRVLDLSSEAFFRLGAVVDWVQECRDEIRAGATRLDDELQARIARLRSDYEKDAISLDRILSSQQFDERAPATFALVHLEHLLAKEAKGYQFKKGNGLDFCHAVLAAAYGSLITLDKEWKGRIKRLPETEKLAETYYRPQIDELITTMEALPPKYNVR